MWKKTFFSIVCIVAFCFIATGCKSDPKPKTEKVEESGVGELAVDATTYSLPYGYRVEADNYYRFIFSNLSQKNVKLTTKTRWTYCDVLLLDVKQGLLPGEYNAQVNVTVEQPIGGEDVQAPLVAIAQGTMKLSGTTNEYEFTFASKSIRIVNNDLSVFTPQNITLKYKGKLIEWE